VNTVRFADARRSAAALALLSAAALCAACGLPRDTRAIAEAIPNTITTRNADIAVKEQQFRALAASAAVAADQVYAEREGWAKQFDQARAKTQEARRAFDRDIAPLLDRNRRGDRDAVAAQVVAIQKLVDEAERAAGVPARRQGYINDLRLHYRDRLQEAAKNMQQLNALASSLTDQARKSKSEFPLRERDIDTRTATLLALAAPAQAAFTRVSTEAANADANRFADLVLLDESARAVSDNATRMSEGTTDLSAQLAALSRSYSKSLADMRVNYQINLERWSWNEDDDSPEIHYYAYPAQDISGELFDYFNAMPESLPYVARFTSGFFGGTSLPRDVDQARWEALNVSPKEAWPAFSDDTAEFGYRLSAEYFHKYLVTEDGRATETDWQSVDEATFEQHAGNLGMDIVSKPYAAFEDEKIVSPTPAGLAFVGNPKYGEWRTDNSGVSFWAWYGAYRLFSDLLGARGLPYNYRRDEWNTWSTGYRGKPYYGEDRDKKERYGTGGYVTGSSSRYANRIPDMRRVTVRHSTGTIGRGTFGGAGK
jgi:hypothetical protein